MQDFTKRRGRGAIVRRFALGTGALLLLAFVSFGAAHAAWGMYGKFAEATDSNAAAQQNLADLSAQEAGVRADVDNLSSQEGQEAHLRQSYGVALPGEGEIQIVRQSPSTTPAAAEPAGNFLVKIFRALFVW